MWSQLANTPVGGIAKVQMDSNGCEYHNWNHVMAMYGYLAKVGHPYSSTLDLAILYHDVIYDSQPRKEIRSADFLKEVSEHAPELFNDLDVKRAMELIYDTIEHRIGYSVSDDSRAIIRADLHQLTSGIHVLTNFANIMAESTKLYKCSYEQFAAANQEFMSGLRNRVRHNFNADPEYQAFWSDVTRGIDETLYLARMVSRKPLDK